MTRGPGWRLISTMRFASIAVGDVAIVGAVVFVPTYCLVRWLPRNACSYLSPSASIGRQTGIGPSPSCRMNSLR